jgi:tetratricopeptide (TPR) repeat protein
LKSGFLPQLGWAFLVIALSVQTSLAKGAPYKQIDIDSVDDFFQKAQVEKTPYHRYKAEFSIAAKLFEMRLFYSALHFYSKIIAFGPTHPFFHKSVAGLIRVAEKQQDDTLVPAILYKYYDQESFSGVKPGILSKIRYSLSLLLHRRQNHQRALDHLSDIEENSQVFAKALFLRAIIRTRLGVEQLSGDDESKARKEYQKALDLFARILDLSGHNEQAAAPARKKYNSIQRLWQLSTLNMARSYYGKGEYIKASELYSRIPKNSKDWPASLFEKGWTHYMLGEYELALGALHSLHSPFLKHRFQPETWILESTIYFQNCDFINSLRALERFDIEYGKMGQEISSLLEKKRMDPGFDLSVMGRTATYLRMILNNPRAVRFFAQKKSIEKELAVIGNTFSGEFFIALIKVLESQKTLLGKIADQFVIDHLIKTRRTLEEFADHANVLRLEITHRKRMLLGREKAMNPTENLVRHQKRDSKRWKFHGEYWQDELGHYVVRVNDLCPAAPE